MSEELEQKVTTPTELDLLKKRAMTMGISFHPNIGLDKLKKKVNDVAKGDDEPGADILMPQTAEPVDEIPEDAQFVTIEQAEEFIRRMKKTGKKTETAGQRRQRLINEAGKLVRINVANMNPNKKDWEGEIYTVSNSLVGTFRKYVPFNNDRGWHVPMIMFKMMKEKECQVFHTVKGPSGRKMRKGKLIKELNIEVMAPLTGEELQELARRQARSHSIDD